METNRSKITDGLSKLLEIRLNDEHRRWAREVPFFYPECRVDYVAFKPASYGWGSVGGIEGGTFSFYEVKSCMADYKSGNGLNFYGDENWLVCPAELSISLRGNMPNGVGIYIPVPKGSNIYAQLKDPTPYTGEVDGWALHKQCDPCNISGFYRKFPATLILAQMLYAKG